MKKTQLFDFGLFLCLAFSFIILIIFFTFHHLVTAILWWFTM